MPQKQNAAVLEPICQEIHSAARLPSMSPLHWACCSHSMKISSNTAHSAVCTCSCSSKGPKKRDVSLVQLGIVPISTTGHLGSLPRSTLKCLPLGPAPKQVCFDLPDDLGNTPQLPADFASFFREDATNKWSNAQHLPTSSVTSLLMPLKRERDQQHSTPAGGAWPKASTAPLARPVAAGRTKPWCSTTPDLVECHGE